MECIDAWFGTIQPERLCEVMNKADDGLLARFVMVWPEPVPFRKPRQTPAVDLAIQWLDRLRLLEMAIDAGGAPTPVLVRLTAHSDEVGR